VSLEKYEQDLTPKDVLPILVPLPHSGIKHDKKPVMPSRIVPDILVYRPLDERDLYRPKFVPIEIRKDPLAIGPSMIILGIFLEDLLNKVQLLKKQLGVFCFRVFGADVR
jgi:hypothetical protein